MPYSIKYGANSEFALEFTPDHDVISLGDPRGGAVDVLQATRQAVSNPLGFPPLRAALVPGDHVAIPLARSTPCAAEVLKALIHELSESGINLGDITILFADPTQPAAVEEVQKALPESVHCLVHNPTDRTQHGFLGPDRDDAPLYVNRALLDADVVLPVGWPDWASHALEDADDPGILLQFLNSERREKHRAPQPSTNPRAVAEDRGSEFHDLYWQLGVNIELQIVPGSRDSALAVLAGTPMQVRPAARRTYEEAWSFESPRGASLVIAGIDGGRTLQTWDAAGQALETCQSLVEAGGAIVLLTELSAPPGPGIQSLGRAEDYSMFLKNLHKKNPEDARAAEQWLLARDHATIFLKSELPPHTVEKLTAVALKTSKELQRLIASHKTCTMISHAQFAIPMRAAE